MISLLIPTIDRPDFLRRYLLFLKIEGFEGEVIIGDSSQKSLYKELEIFIKKNKFDFEVIQKAYPNMQHFEVIRELLPLIKFEYSMYICDDDFLIPSTLIKCKEFLDENHDYSGVGGYNLIVSLNENQNILDLNEYPIKNYEMQSAKERLSALSNNYDVVAYGLFRTKDFIKRWPLENLQEREIAIEIHPCFALVAQGKVKILDDLFVIRCDHERRILLPTLSVKLKGEYWDESVETSCRELGAILTREDGGELNQNINFARNCFDYLIHKGRIAEENSLQMESSSFLIRILSKLKQKLSFFRCLFNTKSTNAVLPLNKFSLEEEEIKSFKNFESLLVNNLGNSNI